MRTAPAKEFISNFIKNEVSYINCKHPDFLGAKKSAISKMTGDSEVRNLKIINYISRSTDLKNENAQLSSSWSSAILTLWGRTSKITCRKLSWISSSTLSKIRFKDSLWRLFTNWRVEANATWKNSWPSPNLLHNNGRYQQIKKNYSTNGIINILISERSLLTCFKPILKPKLFFNLFAMKQTHFENPNSAVFFMKNWRRGINWRNPSIYNSCRANSIAALASVLKFQMSVKTKK